MPRVKMDDVDGDRVRPPRCHVWWWTMEPRHAPCAQCQTGKPKQIPLDLIWGVSLD